MIRKQIYLDERRNEVVRKIAASRGISEGEVIRESIDASGRYAITVQPPPMREMSHVYTLDVAFQAACRADFELYYVGQIRGTVTNGQGRPVAGIISAQPVGIDQSQPVSSVADVVEGRFELKQVPPGRYRIRLFPKVSGRIDSYYYPGTTSETAAVEVEVGDGTVITGLQFTIP